MNKITKIAIIAIVATTISLTANAQENRGIGVQAGLNFSSFSGIIQSLFPYNSEFSAVPGIQFGLISETQIGNSNWSLMSNILYSNLGGRVELTQTRFLRTETERATLNVNVVMIRGHIQNSLPINNELSFAWHTGLHVGYSLWASYSYERIVNGVVVSTDGDAFLGTALNRATDIGVGLGIALIFQDRFRFGLGYDLGILTHNLSISVAYMLPRR